MREGVASQPRPAYNPVFELLVSDKDDLEGYLAYGAYKWAKREWYAAFELRHGRQPSADDIARYAESWTPTSLAALRDNAEGTLGAYSSKLVEAATPSIQIAALRTGRPLWKEVGVGVLAAFSYSVFLLIAALLIRYIGIDLVEVLRRSVQHGP